KTFQLGSGLPVFYQVFRMRAGRVSDQAGLSCGSGCRYSRFLTVPVLMKKTGEIFLQIRTK
ncbi:MAG: hypothetical protein LUQ07_07850, partial [Methanospirillum sp.]|nr:hypothetical protein [Methanospirillum sp.]